MKAQRCQCKNISNNKTCLHKSKNIFIINNKRYCKLHMNYYNHKYATLIQSVYRGYKKRQYLKNIYIKLPNDIQNHILYFVKKDFYIKELNKKLNIILSKKFNNYFSQFNKNLYIDKNNNYTLLIYLAENQKYIIHIFKLYMKYRTILLNNQYIYNNLIQNIKVIKNTLYFYENALYNAFTQHIYTLTDVLYYNIDKIINPNTTLSSTS